MPAYDFRCPSCEHAFQIVRPARDTIPVTCPLCESAAKRVFVPVGVVFKGSGFHNTDYRTRPAASTQCGSSDSGCSTGPVDSGCACTGCPGAE